MNKGLTVTVTLFILCAYNAPTLQTVRAASPQHTCLCRSLDRVRCAHHGGGHGFSDPALQTGVVGRRDPWFAWPDAGFDRYLWCYGVYREPEDERNRHPHGIGRRSESCVVDEFAGRSSAHSHSRRRRIGYGFRTLAKHAGNAVPRRRERSRDLRHRSSRANRSGAARDLLSQSQSYTGRPECGITIRVDR